MLFTDLLAKISDDGEEDETHPLGHELDRFAKDDAEGIKGFFQGLGTWLKEHPRHVLTRLRRVRPVFYLEKKQLAIVTAYETVRDVLSRDHDFAVVYGPKMRVLTGGADFFLGVDDDNVEAHTARVNMDLGFRRDQIENQMIPRIARIADETLDSLGARFDLVDDYLKIVPARFAIETFGLQDCDPKWLSKTTQALFEYLFIDVENSPVVLAEAEAAAAPFRDLLDASIASGKAGPETVIGYGLTQHAAGFAGGDPLSLRNNILGLIIGLVPTTAKSAAMAFDYATQDLEKQADFFKAHDTGDAPAFNRYCRELTRLHPINPGLFRIARRDTVLNYNGNAREIKAGTKVFASTATAMVDKKVLEDPLEIRLDRPETHYLTYGYGLHACTGRYLNDLHISRLLSRALARGRVDRVADTAGDLKFDGKWPSSLTVEIK